MIRVIAMVIIKKEVINILVIGSINYNQHMDSIWEVNAISAKVNDLNII